MMKFDPLVIFINVIDIEAMNSSETTPSLPQQFKDDVCFLPVTVCTECIEGVLGIFGVDDFFSIPLLTVDCRKHHPLC